MPRFWSRAIKHSTHQAQKHFITNATEFLKAIIIQATDRESEVARNVDDFMVLRRASVGAGNLFFGYEMTLNLPDEVYFHPIIDKLHEYCADMIAIDNVNAPYASLL